MPAIIAFRFGMKPGGGLMLKAARRVVRLMLPVAARGWLLAMAARIHPALKHAEEDAFWDRMQAKLGPEPDTEYYREFILRMGDINDETFFRDKIVVDIGCGPRGSLTWLGIAKGAIGLDPLVERYRRFGIADHPHMVYLQGSAERMPFPSESVDVVISMNSLDHVDDVRRACQEIRRVVKLGGHFIGSLNLEEAPTATEPFRLTEEWLRRNLFQGWAEEFCRVRPKVPPFDELWGPYKYFLQAELPANAAEVSGPRAMWCRFRKV